MQAFNLFGPLLSGGRYSAMKKIITITTLLIPVLAFSLENKVREEVWIKDTSVVSCEPKILRKEGTLSIKLGPNHGKEFAIVRESDRRFYVLVVNSPPKEMNSLMSSSEFKKAKSVAINTSTVGFPWEADATNELIFVQPGKYTILISEILESELGGYICTIEYLP